MRKTISVFLLIGLLGASMFLGGCGTGPNPLRLHVVANSNTKEDQAVKLKVRDDLLKYSGQAMEEADSMEEAEDYVLGHMAEIESNATAVLKENGFDYGAAVSVGEFYFPEKKYGGTVYPAGFYQAVKIVLGAGAGDNWWCVIFPPLCIIAAPGDGEGGEEDGREEDGAVRIRYRSIFEEWLGG